MVCQLAAAFEHAAGVRARIGMPYGIVCTPMASFQGPGLVVRENTALRVTSRGQVPSRPPRGQR